MKSGSREHILNRVKEALDKHPVKPGMKKQDTNEDVWHPADENLEIIFAKALHDVDGKFVFCSDNKELILNLKEIVNEENWENVYCNNPNIQELLLEAEIPFTSAAEDFHQMQVALTGCEYLIARFGSVMVSSAQTAGRQLNVYPPVHIVLAKTSQLVPEIKDGLKNIQEKYKNDQPSMIALITGPSRTADIEKTLILGMHGPKDLYVFLVDDSDEQ